MYVHARYHVRMLREAYNSYDNNPGTRHGQNGCIADAENYAKTKLHVKTVYELSLSFITRDWSPGRAERVIIFYAFRRACIYSYIYVRVCIPSALL